jgi:hypothetical protein
MNIGLQGAKKKELPYNKEKIKNIVLDGGLEKKGFADNKELKDAVLHGV